MKRLAKAPWLSGMALALFLSAALMGGCKQGEGDVCQIDDDCKSGLVCNPGTMRCQQPGQVTVDARVTIDSGPTIDAPPAPDADTTPDATPVDADMTPDAEVVDAMTTD